MGMAQASLTELLGIISDAVSPDPVKLDDSGTEPNDGSQDASVLVRAGALARIGRSRRDGPVLDLELTVSVNCRGPHQLENLEKLILALELHSKYSLFAFGVPAGGEAAHYEPKGPDVKRPPAPTGLGFLVRVPVSLRLDEPVGPPVLDPVIVKTAIGRRISGRLLNVHNEGIPNARIRPQSSTTAVVSDSAGRFEVLASPDELQRFAVAVRGEERHVTATTATLPLTIRWE